MCLRSFGNDVTMQCFSVTEIQNTPSEALHQAAVEPVLLTAESQTSYVIMSFAERAKGNREL
jgi:hypothetical protein